jgi:hypothetical protein
MSDIGENTLIARSTDVMVAAVRDETVMMDAASGHYYGLDDIGSEIWRRLETPCIFAALVDGLAADFDADRAVIAEDVRKLLAMMAEHKVVIFTSNSKPQE